MRLALAALHGMCLELAALQGVCLELAALHDILFLVTLPYSQTTFMAPQAPRSSVPETHSATSAVSLAPSSQDASSPPANAA